jgi:hypothetical protein
MSTALPQSFPETFDKMARFSARLKFLESRVGSLQDAFKGQDLKLASHDTQIAALENSLSDIKIQWQPKVS